MTFNVKKWKLLHSNNGNIAQNNQQIFRNMGEIKKKNLASEQQKNQMQFSVKNRFQCKFLLFIV